MPADYHVHRPDESDAHVEKAPDTSPWMTVLVVLAILAGFGSHCGRAYWIKSQGVALVPTQAHAVTPVPFYLQNDPR